MERAAVHTAAAAHLPHVRPGRDLVTRPVLAPGSEELTRIFRERGEAIVSNDTSGASGYAPLSATERLVLAVERWLNGPGFKRAFPDTGEDVKVLAVREDARVMLPVGMPRRCTASPSRRAAGGEAAPGKTPVARAGKVYSVLSHRLAALIHARCPALEEVYVHLAARIGEPVDRPWTGVQVVLPAGAALADVEPAVREVVLAGLARLPALRG